MIAGVATGMADAFHVDVRVVRVIWVVVAVASFGLGVAAYAICWLAFPSDEHPAPLGELHYRNRDRNLGFAAGLVLLGIGLIIVFGQAMPPFRRGGSLVWAAVLIGGGLAILLLRHPDDEITDSGTVTAPADPPASQPPAGTSEATTTSPPPVADSTAWVQHAPWPAPPPPPQPPWDPTGSRPAWPRPPRRRRRSFLTPLTVSVLLIAGGGAALLDSAGAVHLTVAGVLAAALVVVGLALVASAWFGRARGLIPIGVLLLLAAIPAATIDVPITGGVGDRHYHPVARTTLHRKYQLGIGQLVIDLRDAPLSGRVTTISGSLGIGELDVDVPDNVRVDVRAHAGAGATDIFGRREGGWPQDTRQLAGAGERGVLHLDLRVGAGSIRVRRWSPGGAFVTP
jgi:phage shock protein PspC (stress-responsive transcriptional regulator)